MSHETSQETVFDRLSRILATPMPRRQALSSILKLVSGTALASLLPAELAALPLASTKAPNIVPILQMPIINFHMKNAEVDEVVEVLRMRFRVPISLFRQHNPTIVSIDVNHGTVQDVVNQIRQQSLVYQVKLVKDRAVLFDDASLLLTKIPGINLVNVPRPEAGALYSVYLQQHVKNFDRFGTRTIGNLTAPSAQLPVTLSQNVTFLQNLVELLGNDPTAAFTVVPESMGWLVWTMTQVPLQPEMPVAKLTNHTRTAEPHIMIGSDSGSASQVDHAVMPNASNSDTTCRPLSVSYASPQTTPCTAAMGGTCGYASVFTITGITACSGDHCAGHCLNEQVTQSSNCAKTGVNQNSSPCAIPLNDDGSISNGTASDTYGLCGAVPPPPGGCTTTLTQTLTVTGLGGGTASVNTIVLTVTGCGQGSAVPSNAPAATQSQCCGSNPPTSGPGSKTLCSSSQKCVTDIPSLISQCFPSTTTYSCGGVCCQSGQNCAADRVTGKYICCPSSSGNPGTACNGVCCPANNTCVGGGCCPPGQATSDNKKCCTAGQSPPGTICCPTGQVNVGGICCTSGQINCGGVCCTGTCDSSGACIPPPDEKK